LSCGFAFVDEGRRGESVVVSFNRKNAILKIASLPIGVMKHQIMAALEMFKARWKTLECFCISPVPGRINLT